MTTTTSKPVVRVGMRTPWGKADGIDIVMPGIGWVFTPGHGGVKLSPAMNRRMPDYMRQKGGWYEEDCESAKVYVALTATLATVENDTTDKLREAAVSTLRNWYPDAYERFFGETIAPGDSYIKDERTFHAEHVNDLVVISATNCPRSMSATSPSMVKVTATVGGKRGNGDERYFLVTVSDYETRSRFGFVIDPAKHKEVV